MLCSLLSQGGHFLDDKNGSGRDRVHRTQRKGHHMRHISLQYTSLILCNVDSCISVLLAENVRVSFKSQNSIVQVSRVSFQVSYSFEISGFYYV